tara:strand:+ start:2605 stop:3483 length:879 start_codon:yes stop_codon:yes gene_type:complete
MASSESKELFQAMFRLPTFEGEISFDTILKEVVKSTLGKDGISLDEFVNSKGIHLWNYFNKGQSHLKKINTCSPVYTVISDKYKIIKSTAKSNPKKYPPTKLQRFKSRPFILKEIDKLNSREYEALACCVLKLLGAKKIYLTPPGNEAGIDFISVIDFGPEAHFLFGINGPLRVIGQCKKYSTESQVSSIKEFNQTLSDVYSLTDKVKTVIPHWFRSAKGPIIGWMISHSGFQSGAVDRAKNYGLICSDSKDLAEVISISRKFHGDLDNPSRALKISGEIKGVLENEEYNKK